MKTMLRNTFSIMLLLPFLAGTFGISAREHRCNASKKIKVTLFPEFSSQSGGCCCSSFPQAMSQPEEPGSETLDSPECCKTISLYFKADFQTTQAQPAVSDAPVQLALEIILYHDFDLRASFPFESLLLYTDTGPPLTGRQRVISFHQTKIPGC